MKQAKKILFISGGFLIVIFFGILIATQTDNFKKYLRDKILISLKNEINGEIKIGNLYGNILTGFTIDGIEILKNENKILSATNIKIKYDLLSVIIKKISISEIDINKPIFRIETDANGKYNYEDIFKQNKREENNWELAIKELKISNGIIFFANKNRREIFSNINYLIQVESIEDDLNIIIKNGELKTNSKFKINKISGEIKSSNKKIELKNFNIQTNTTDLTFNILVDNLNNKIKINIPLSEISKEDLNYLLGKNIFIPDRIKLNTIVDGEINKIKINECKIQTQYSEINIYGNIINPTNFENIKFDIYTGKANIRIDDFNNNFTEKNYLKNTNYDFSLNYNSDIRDNKINFNFKNGEGSIEGFLNDKIGEIKIKNISVENIFSNFKNKILLNSVSSFNLDENQNIITTKIYDSKFNDVEIKNIEFDVLNKNDNYNLNYEIVSNAGKISGNTKFKYLTDIKNISTFVNFENINLFHFTKHNKHNSSLNGALNLYLDNLNIESDSVALKLNFFNSTINRTMIDSGQSNLSITGNSFGDKTIKIESPFASGLITGKYKIENVINLYNNLKNELIENGKYYFTENKIASPKLIEDFDLKYNLKIKNSEIVQLFQTENEINANADLKGEIKSVNNIVSSNGIIQINRAELLNDNLILLADNILFHYDFKNYTQNCFFKPNSKFEYAIKTTAKNIFYNNSTLNHFAIENELKNGIGRFLLYSEIDSLAKTEIQGSMSVNSGFMNVKISSVYGKIQDFEILNSSPFDVFINSNIIKIDSAELSSSDEKIKIGNILIKDENISGQINFENMMIKNLSYLAKGDVARFIGATEGKVTAKIELGGMRSNPIVNLIGETSTIKLNSISLGKIYLKTQLNPNVVNLNLLLSSEKNPNLPLLKFNGAIPIGKNRSNDSIMVIAELNNFPATLIDPFIGEVENFRGNINGKIIYNGTNKNPIANGSLETKNTKLVLVQNGIEYILDAKIKINNNQATLENCFLKNNSDDFSKGKATLSGNILINDFIPSSYNLTLKGELKVLANESKHYTPNMYGQIIASTENESIQINGNFISTDIKGKIFITNASVVLPPTREDVFVKAEQPFNIVIVDDTTKNVIDSLSIPDIVKFLEARMKLQQILDENKNTTSINYDLVFISSGANTARFIFNSATNEELLAYLDGSLNMKTRDSKIQITGQIDLKANSYYSFYKKFSASGSLLFTGNPSNPKLDIVAKYEAEHKKIDTTATKPLEKVRVKFIIGGDRIEPKIKISLFVLDDSKNEIERFGDVESDAISFLLTSSDGVPGKFRNDLTLNDKQNIAQDLGISIGSSVLSNFTNTILSGMLMDFIRAANIPFVSTVEFGYSSDAPVLRLSGEVLDAYWSIGGKIFNDINNTNLNVQLPLSAIVGNKNLRNLIFEIERKIDPLDQNAQKNAIHGARIYYKIHF